MRLGWINAYFRGKSDVQQKPGIAVMVMLCTSAFGPILVIRRKPVNGRLILPMPVIPLKRKRPPACAWQAWPRTWTLCSYLYRVDDPDQFSTAPFSIQTRMVSISSALRGSLPCGIVIVSMALPETRLYSELVMAEPGLMTDPNREPFIIDS